jgi:transposase-like protein
MPRAGKRDRTEERHWRQIIADVQSSTLSVAEYCRQNGIKEHQYYRWLKNVRECDAEQSANHRQRLAARAKQIAYKAKREKRGVVEFAEVQVVDREHAHVAKPAADSAGMIEVVLATGTTVRISAGCSLELLASVLNLLENR